MSLTNSPNWFSASSSGFYPYTIGQSLRFEDGASAYLARTPSSASNRTTWTWSAWIKRGNISQSTNMFISYSGSNDFEYIRFDSDDTIRYTFYISGAVQNLLSTSSKFRDTSSWYHILVQRDGSSSEIYVNGVQQPLQTETRASTNGYFNNNNLHEIGRFSGSGVQRFDGYMAEVNFVDGTSLDPTSFGETKAGIWIPKQYSGSYGTNGFYLDFADGSALGDDESGNGNDFTATGLASTDVVLDSPTNNWATMNFNDGNGPTIQEGNLKVYGDTSYAVFEGFKGTFPMSSGKWYWEVYISVGGFTQTGITPTIATAVGGSTNLSYHTDAMVYESNGKKAIGTGGLGTAPTGLSRSTYGASYTTGDIIGVALDLDSATTTLTFYKNNSSQGTAFSSLANDEYVALHTGIQNNFGIFNFGQDSSFAGTKTAQGNTDDNGQGDFYYTPPSGFLACCTANLPDPAIDPAQDEEPADYFNTVLYTGTGSTRSVTGVGFQPDFVWIKDRTTAYDHHLFDVVRGGGNSLYSNDTVAENTYPTDITFASDGFSIANGSAYPQIYLNKSSDAFVSWNWLAGGTAASNTDGTITSSVSANTKAGFSIVGFTSSGSSATVGHGLDSPPEFIIAKNRESATVWSVYAEPIGNTKRLRLNTTDATQTSGVWGNTTPTSTVFTQNLTSATDDMICYCFHSVSGFSAVGSYTGNGSSDGVFVPLTFRPAFLLIKITSGTTASWYIYDSARNTFNEASSFLRPDLANAELTGTPIDILSNGFKIKSSSSGVNYSAANYIYLAFAEQPWKYSNAR